MRRIAGGVAVTMPVCLKCGFDGRVYSFFNQDPHAVPVIVCCDCAVVERCPRTKEPHGSAVNP